MSNEENNNRNEINISTPWGGSKIAEHRQSAVGSDEVTIEFVKERTRLHESYIKEEANSKRLALILSAFLFVTALFVVMFAPAGREKLSYWVGATLLLFSAGAAGYKRLWVKAPLITFEANDKK